MNKFGCFALVLATTIYSLGSHASTIPTDDQSLIIPTVFVGSRGNLRDPRSQILSQGAVDYNFRIGATEVTNAQYAKFLNSVDSGGSNLLNLYNPAMSSGGDGGIDFDSASSAGFKYQAKFGRENYPVVYVSWYDAIRFANWLHNGQRNGDTEDGAYSLGELGPNGVPTNGTAISRNAGARWWLPSNDEWYKAAFHKNDGPTSNYWKFPTSADAEPYSVMPPGTDSLDPSNAANFLGPEGFVATGSHTYIESQDYLTEVGAYTYAVSPYGTYDQGGNAQEWNDTLFIEFDFEYRGNRGGSWVGDWTDISSQFAWSDDPVGEFRLTGFRVATIPEPNTLPMIGLAVAGFAMANCGRCNCRGRIRKTVGLAY